MSTKTSFKRIALVAASALAIAGFSAVPANAADSQSASGTVSSINLKAVTANTLVVNAAQSIFVGSTQVTQAAPGAGNNLLLNYKAYLSSYPAGGFVAATAAVTAGLTITGQTAIAATGSTLTITGGTNAAIAAEAITATGTAGLGSFSFTPTVVGAYTVTVWNDQDVDGVVDVTEAIQTVSLTVVAASAFSTGTSSAYLVAGNTTAGGTIVTNAAGASGSKTMSTANVAAITVSLKDAANVALASGNTITATITGSGGVGGTTVDLPVASQCSATTVVRSIAVTADAINTIYVCADGTAGVGTVTISVTNAAGVTAVLATRTVTFYGAIATLTLVSTPLSVLRAGGYQSGAITGLTGVTAALSAAVVVKAADSGGNLVQGLTITGVSSSTSIIASSAVGEDTVANDADSIYGGPGYYVAHVTSATSSASGNTATVTYRILNPADGVTYLTAVATFTVGGSVASETLSFDKTSYNPGEPVVLTRTAKDSAGNPVFDGAASPAVTFNKSVGGTAPAASFYVGGKKATSATAPTLFAPVSTGDFMALATSGNAAGSALSATASVAADTTAADGAALALDAANAATDAANNAYDEAQNATQAASDALAAVTALATQVESLIAMVKTLTAAVAKLNMKKKK